MKFWLMIIGFFGIVATIGKTLFQILNFILKWIWLIVSSPFKFVFGGIFREGKKLKISKYRKGMIVGDTF